MLGARYNGTNGRFHTIDKIADGKYLVIAEITDDPQTTNSRHYTNGGSYATARLAREALHRYDPLARRQRY